MSFGRVLTFIQSLFAAQTIEPEIVECSGFGLYSIGQLGAWIWNFICEGLYFMIRWLLAVVDFMQYFIQKLIGLDYWLKPGGKTMQGATDNDLLFQFLYNDTVQDVFRAMVGVFIILLVIFVIFSIVRSEWKYATGDGKSGNSKVQIFRDSFKAFLLVLVFPLVLTLGIISSNAILASLVGALNLNMSSTFGGTLFSIAAEQGNKYRMYANSGEKAPVSQQVTFYVDNQLKKVVLFSNGTTHADTDKCEYISDYGEYLERIYGKTESGTARCTKHTVDTTFDVVVPDETGNFSGYCVGLQVDGSTKFFLVKCTYAEKEGMYYYLNNVLGGKVLSKNTKTNANKGLTGDTVNSLWKDLKGNMESFGTQSFISGLNLNGFGNGAVITAAYNTWGSASVYMETTEFDMAQSFQMVYSDILSKMGISGTSNAKLSFNSDETSPYFDNGQFGFVGKQAEYRVMADVIDFISNNTADLYIVDATSSSIKWEHGSYFPESRWITGNTLSDGENAGKKGVNLVTVANGYNATPAQSTVLNDKREEVLPFVVAYSDLGNDVDMGNQLYMAHYNTSSELEGAVYLMCWKIIEDGQTKYVPLVNGKSWFDEDRQITMKFKSEFLANNYRGVIVAKGFLEGTGHGRPTYINSGLSYANSSGSLLGSLGSAIENYVQNIKLDAPHYYKLEKNSQIYQYAENLIALNTGLLKDPEDNSIDGAAIPYSVTSMAIEGVSGSLYNSVTPDTNEVAYYFVNDSGQEITMTDNSVENLTINIRNNLNNTSTTATYAGVKFEKDDGTAFDDDDKFLFVTSAGGYFVVGANIGKDSKIYIHELTGVDDDGTISASTGASSLGEAKSRTLDVKDGPSTAEFKTVSFTVDLVAYYVANDGTKIKAAVTPNVSLDLFEITNSKLGSNEDKSVFRTVDMQYIEIKDGDDMLFSQSMYMNLSFYTNKNTMFSYSSAGLKIAKPIEIELNASNVVTNSANVQSTIFFDINYYSYLSGYISDENKIVKYDIYSSSNNIDDLIKEVTNPIDKSTFGVNAANFSWGKDEISYDLYDGDRYVATIYKPETDADITNIENLPTVTTTLLYDYKSYENIQTRNTHTNRSNFLTYSKTLKKQVIVGFYRDELAPSSFGKFAFDFNIPFPDLWNMRFKLASNLFDINKDIRVNKVFISDSLAFDYFFDVDSVNYITLATFYDPAKVSSPISVGFWIMIIAGALIIKILGTALWGVIKRFYEITLYYIAMPAVASTIVLDSGTRFKSSIQDPLIGKVLSTYGVILGINAFFVLLAPVRSMSNIFTAADIATSGSYFLKALSNLPLFGSDELTAKMLNSYTYILFLLVAFTMIDELPKVITQIMGTKGDVHASGEQTKNDVKKTMKEAGEVASGKALLDAKDQALQTVGGMLPGAAFVTAAIDAKKQRELKKQQMQQQQQQRNSGGPNRDGDYEQTINPENDDSDEDSDDEGADRLDTEEGGLEDAITGEGGPLGEEGLGGLMEGEGGDMLGAMAGEMGGDPVAALMAGGGDELLSEGASALADGGLDALADGGMDALGDLAGDGMGDLLGEGAGELLGETGEIGSAIAVGLDVVGEVGGAVAEGVGDVVSNVADGVTDAVSSVAEGVGDAVSNVADGMADAAADMAEGVGEELEEEDNRTYKERASDALDESIEMSESILSGSQEENARIESELTEGNKVIENMLKNGDIDESQVEYHDLNGQKIASLKRGDVNGTTLVGKDGYLTQAGQNLVEKNKAELGLGRPGVISRFDMDSERVLEAVQLHKHNENTIARQTDFLAATQGLQDEMKNAKTDADVNAVLDKHDIAASESQKDRYQQEINAGDEFVRTAVEKGFVAEDQVDYMNFNGQQVASFKQNAVDVNGNALFTDNGKWTTQAFRDMAGEVSKDTALGAENRIGYHASSERDFTTAGMADNINRYNDAQRRIDEINGVEGGVLSTGAEGVPAAAPGTPEPGNGLAAGNTQNADNANAAENAENAAATQNAETEQADQTIAENNAKIDANNAVIDQNNSTIDANNAKIDENKSTIDSNNAKIEENNGTIEANEDKMKENNATIAENDKEIAKNEKEIDSNNGKISKKQDEIAKLEEANAGLDPEKDAAKIEANQAKIDAKKTEIGDLESENQAFAEDTAQRSQQNSTLEGENTQLGEQNTSLEGENTQLGEQNTSLEGENVQIEEQNAELQKDNEARLAENKQYEEENLKVLASASDTTAEADNSAAEANNAAIAENNELIKAGEEEIAEKGKEVFESSDKIDQLVESGELDASKVVQEDWSGGKSVNAVSDAAEAEKLGVMSAADVKDAKETVEARKEDITELKAENTALETANEEAVADPNAELSEGDKELLGTVDSKESNIDYLNQEMEKTGKTLDRFKSDNSRVETQVTNGNKIVETMLQSGEVDESQIEYHTFNGQQIASLKNGAVNKNGVRLIDDEGVMTDAGLDSYKASKELAGLTGAGSGGTISSTRVSKQMQEYAVDQAIIDREETYMKSLEESKSAMAGASNAIEVQEVANNVKIADNEAYRTAQVNMANAGDRFVRAALEQGGIDESQVAYVDFNGQKIATLKEGAVDKEGNRLINQDGSYNDNFDEFGKKYSTDTASFAGFMSKAILEKRIESYNQRGAENDQLKENNAGLARLKSNNNAVAETSARLSEEKEKNTEGLKLPPLPTTSSYTKVEGAIGPKLAVSRGSSSTGGRVVSTGTAVTPAATVTDGKGVSLVEASTAGSSTSASAARWNSMAGANGQKFEVNGRDADVAKRSYNADAVNATSRADRFVAFANVIRNQSATNVGRAVGLKAIDAQLGGIQNAQLSEQTKEALIVSSFNAVRRKAYEAADAETRKEMLKDYDVAGAVDDKGNLSFAVSKGGVHAGLASIDATNKAFEEIMTSDQVSAQAINQAISSTGNQKRIATVLSLNAALGVDYSKVASGDITSLQDENIVSMVSSNKKYDGVVAEAMLAHIVGNKDKNPKQFEQFKRDFGIFDEEQLKDPATHERVVDQISRLRRADGANMINTMDAKEFAPELASTMRSQAQAGKLTITAWDMASKETQQDQTENVQAIRAGVIREDLAAAEKRMSIKAVQGNEANAMINALASTEVDNKSYLVGKMVGALSETDAKKLEGLDDNAKLAAMAKLDSGAQNAALGALQANMDSEAYSSMLHATASKGVLGISAEDRAKLQAQTAKLGIDANKLSYFDVQQRLSGGTTKSIASAVEKEAASERDASKLVASQGHLVSQEQIKNELAENPANQATASAFANAYAGKINLVGADEEADIRRKEAIKVVKGKVAGIDDNSSMDDINAAIDGNVLLQGQVYMAGNNAVDLLNKQRLASGMAIKNDMYAEYIMTQDKGLYNKARKQFRQENHGKELDEVDSMTRNSYLANNFRAGINSEDLTLLDGAVNKKMKDINVTTETDVDKLDRQIMKNMSADQFGELYAEAKRENYGDDIAGINSVKANILQKNAKDLTPAVNTASMGTQEKAQYDFTRNLLQQMTRGGNNSELLVNAYNNTNLFNKGQIDKEIDERFKQLLAKAGKKAEDNPAEQAKLKAQATIETLNTHEDYKETLITYAAADVTRTMDDNTKNAKYAEIAKSSKSLDSMVVKQLEKDGGNKDNIEDYKAAMNKLLNSNEQFKNSMYGKLTASLNPNNTNISENERNALFDLNAYSGGKSDKTAIKNLDEWLSTYAGSGGKETGNVLLSSRKKLPVRSAAYDNWNGFIDKKIADIKGKKGAYANMSADQRKAEVAKFEKQYIGRGDTDSMNDEELESYLAQQNKNKEMAFKVGDFTKLYKKGEKVGKVKSANVLNVMTKNGLDAHSGFDVLTGKKQKDEKGIYAGLQKKHMNDYQTAENNLTKFKATAAMRTSATMLNQQSFEATAKNYGVNAASVDKQAKSEMTKKYGKKVDYANLTTDQQSDFAKFREQAMQAKLVKKKQVAAKKVANDSKDESYSVSHGIRETEVRLRAKKFNEQESVVSKTGKKARVGEAKTTKLQQNYGQAQNDFNAVAEFNRQFKGTAREYKAQFKAMFGENSAQSKALDKIYSQKGLNANLDKKSASIQMREVMKHFEAELNKAEKRMKNNSHFIPANLKPYVGETLRSAAGKRERDLQRNTLEDYSDAMKHMSSSKQNKKSFDDAFAGLSTAMRSKIFAGMSEKGKQDFHKMDDSKKYEFVQKKLETGHKKVENVVRKNNFFGYDNDTYTKLNGVSIKRTKESRETKELIKKLPEGEAIKYKQYNSEQDRISKKINKEGEKYTSMQTEYETASPQRRVVLKKKMGDSIKILKQYDEELQVVTKKKKEIIEKVSQSVHAGDVRKGLGLARGNGQNVLKDYNVMHRPGPGRPLEPVREGSPQARAINLAASRFILKYRTQIQNMCKTDLYKDVQTIDRYTKQKLDKLSNDFGKVISDNRQLRNYLTNELNKFREENKRDKLILQQQLTNDIARLDAAEKQLKSDLVKAGVQISGISKKVTAQSKIKPKK